MSTAYLAQIDVQGAASRKREIIAALRQASGTAMFHAYERQYKDRSTTLSLLVEQTIGLPYDEGPAKLARKMERTIRRTIGPGPWIEIVVLDSDRAAWKRPR